MKYNIGVLALQGAFREHIQAIKRINHYPVEVRETRQLKLVDALIIPGGESTTISKLLVKYDFINVLRKWDKPLFGTCAGAILLAKKVSNLKEPILGLMDIEVDRNAYGRQIESFEADININIGTSLLKEEMSLYVPSKEMSPIVFHGVFIRAPKITKIGKGVQVLCVYDKEPVLVRQGQYLAATFHPELTEDYIVHRYFVDEIVAKVPCPGSLKKDDS